jgi:aspartyl-tRNA(Asn)/glutamyl-tRNA(Gln) amidotransferase subunit C
MDIRYVAHLARIELTQEELTKFGEQLGGVLRYMEQLKSMDVAAIEPTAHPFPLVNVTRPDVVAGCLSPEAALENAPAAANGLFLVPKIVE